MVRDFADIFGEEYRFFACTIVAFNYKSMNVKSDGASMRLPVDVEAKRAAKRSRWHNR